MAGEWATLRLKDVCSKIGSGATPRGGSSVYQNDGEFALVRSQNVRNDAFDHNGLAFIESHHAEKLANVALEQHDVLLNITGDSVARCCQVDPDVLPARVNQHVAIIRPDSGKLYHLYLRYHLVSPLMQNEMLSLAGVGATRNALTKGMIEDFEIPLPPLPEQKAIAHVLGSLDDKIELNRRMNETLEGMAQALFKSWFVDFDPVIDNALAAGNPIPEPLAQRAETRRQAIANGTANRESAQAFPASFSFTEELGWIPEGWEELKAESLVNRKKVNQKFTKKNVLDSGEVTVFDQGSGLILGYHDGQPDVESSVENPSFIFGDHTCITHLSTKPFSVGPNVIPLSALDHDPYWTYYAIKDVQTFQEYRRHWMEFKIKSVLVPTKSITCTFGNIVCNFYLAMESNSEESQTLAKLRDVLLPKLISGELRIPQAEKMVEEAIA